MSGKPSPRTTPPSKPPKMAFGSSVDTLLEVYANCISLLKAFKRRGEGSTSRSKDEQDRKQVRLRKSLKSDRARVQRAYSSAVSEAGSRFEKGDDRARSALSRVLRKLKAAITNILRSASGHQVKQVLDYESLMLLSNASRSETIRTFDQLSRRLGRSESRITVVTNSSSSGRKERRSGGSSSSASTTSGKSTGNSSSSSSSSSRGKDGLLKKRTASPEGKDGKKRTSDRETKVKKSSKMGSTPSSLQTKQTPTRPQQHAKQTDKVPPLRTPTHHRRSPIQQPPTAVPNRMSLASIATDSTKLGEIPERKWTSTRLQRRRGSEDSTLDEDGYYNVAPVFPLTRYESPVKERRFLGLFRRRS